MKPKGDEDRTAPSSGASHEVTPSTTGVRASSSEYSKQTSSSKEIKEDKLKQARVEMGEVREENKRLKSLLSQIAKDYQCLQMQFRDALQQEGKINSAVPKTTSDNSVQSQGGNDTHETDGELVVSLTLGRNLSSGTSDQIDDGRKLDLNEAKSDNDMPEEGLKLGLDCGYADRVCASESVKQASRESLEGLKNDEIAKIWPPSKILKTVKTTDDECSQPMSQVKKARVSIRARCDTPTMNDGCQWRKYGQKIAKGNPCPRAYYRCTISSSCPVRKQVQRCVDDMSILITTYEGNHNHPLPASATAMASTTSAAVSMLNSRSSTSQKDPDTSATVAPYNPVSTTSASLHGLSFSQSQNSRSNRLTYFPNSSISTCNSHPTITLDLTSPINSSNYDRFASNTSSSHVPKYYSTSCLNFASSSTVLGSSQLFSPWESSNFLSYKATPENRSIHFRGGSFDLGRQENRENSYKRSYLQMSGLSGSSQESLMSETIAAATKAIATNPSFHSALAAALSSCVGNGNHARELNYAPRLRLGDSSLASNPVQISGQSKVPCASSFQGKPVNMNFQQQGGMINLFPPSLSLSTSTGGSSGSPTEHYKDQIKFLAHSGV